LLKIQNNLTVLMLYIIFKKITYCVYLTSISIYPSPPPRSKGLVDTDTVDVFKDFLMLELLWMEFSNMECRT
jgi:hypothetical protein